MGAVAQRPLNKTSGYRKYASKSPNQGLFDRLRLALDGCSQDGNSKTIFRVGDLPHSVGAKAYRASPS